jgi:hypothetical protein
MIQSFQNRYGCKQDCIQEFLEICRNMPASSSSSSSNLLHMCSSFRMETSLVFPSHQSTYHRICVAVVKRARAHDLRFEYNLNRRLLKAWTKSSTAFGPGGSYVHYNLAQQVDHCFFFRSSSSRCRRSKHVLSSILDSCISLVFRKSHA